MNHSKIGSRSVKKLERHKGELCRQHRCFKEKRDERAEAWPGDSWEPEFLWEKNTRHDGKGLFQRGQEQAAYPCLKEKVVYSIPNSWSLVSDSSLPSFSAHTGPGKTYLVLEKKMK